LSRSSVGLCESIVDTIDYASSEDSQGCEEIAHHLYTTSSENDPPSPLVVDTSPQSVDCSGFLGDLYSLAETVWDASLQFVSMDCTVPQSSSPTVVLSPTTTTSSTSTPIKDSPTTAKEVTALVAWLQTFPSFDYQLVQPGEIDAADRLWDVLDQLPTVRAIWTVGQQVCEDDSLNDDENTNFNEPSKIWTSLLLLTAQRARPSSTANEKLTPHRLKCHVLANLLDCAVAAPNLNHRRTYIERIMTLERVTQKTLMALIEQRGRRSSSSRGSRTRTSSTKKRSPQRSARLSSSISRHATPPVPQSTPPVLRSSLRCNATPPVDPHEPPPTPVRSNTKDSRSHSLAFGHSPTATGFSPPPSKRLLDSEPRYANSSAPGFLSPGTLDSPARVQSIVRDLQHRNESLQSLVDAAQSREEEVRAQMEQKEQQQRKHMMQIESAARQKQLEQEGTLQSKLESLQRELQVAKEQAESGQQAQRELMAAREEMEVMQSSQQAWNATNEKLNKFRDKVTELSDVKEALAREQAQHGKAVDELVRLETEVQNLQNTKRQLDDYKIRAIEAEVQLVECQDHMRRMEQQASDSSDRNGHLWKESVTQKAQMEELVARIQEETQANMDAVANGDGVGVGISELNPELQQELVRLRNENLQLRAFAAKRQNDAVEELEARLDDSQRLANRYKEEFLSTKESLVETQTLLGDIQQREAKLSVDLDEWKQRATDAEALGRILDEKLTQCREKCEETKEELSDTTNQAQELRREKEELQSQLESSNSELAQRFQHQEQLESELEETRKCLEKAEQKIEDLREDVKTWEAQTMEFDLDLRKAADELKESEQTMAATKILLAESQQRADKLNSQIEQLKEEHEKLRDQSEEDKQANQVAIKEAHDSLETTRLVLVAKAQKEQDVLQSNMNKLLEDERKASRRKEDEASRKLDEVLERSRNEINDLQKRMATSLKNSRAEAQDRMDRIKGEYQSEMESARKEIADAKETTDNVIRKGRAMLEEAKKRAMEDYSKLRGEIKSVEEERDAIKKEKEELECSLRRKVSSLQHELNLSVAQINDFTRETDELQENIRKAERDKYKLQEDNDRYRRQLGGRYGADGKVQSQLEKLQKEYNLVLDENRNLKKQGRFGGQEGLSSISENGEGDGSRSYSRSGTSRSTISQLRREYEETIEALNDEKRELVMRNSAAITDVQKAEQRAWEREQEVTRMQDEMTSLKLALQRVEFANDRSLDTVQRSPKDLSFFSAQDRSPGLLTPEGCPESPGMKANGLSSAAKRSPSILRAMRQKNAREAALRGQFTSFTASPERSGRRLSTNSTPPRPASFSPGSKTLEPTQTREVIQNRSSPGQRRSSTGSYGSPQAKMASDVFNLGITTNNYTNRIPDTKSQPSSLMQHVRADEQDADENGQPECQQS
jgi:chromosome segregation ATPase